MSMDRQKDFLLPIPELVRFHAWSIGSRRTPLLPYRAAQGLVEVRAARPHRSGRVQENDFHAEPDRLYCFVERRYQSLQLVVVNGLAPKQHRYFLHCVRPSDFMLTSTLCGFINLA